VMLHGQVAAIIGVNLCWPDGLGPSKKKRFRKLGLAESAYFLARMLNNFMEIQLMFEATTM
jgi:hypothetical protein